MMNAIPETQNTPRQLDRLAAQRQLYSDGKSILVAQIILSVPCVIVLSFLVAGFPEVHALKTVAAAWGAVLTVLDIAYFSNRVVALRERGAKVQELFDCDVLQLEWRDLKAGHRPDAEAIMQSSSEYKCKDPECSSLRDWYPVGVGRLPIHLARIICQRANCWWDAQLRRRYADYVLAGLVALAAVVLIVGFVGGLTLDKFFLAVALPLMPALVWSARQRKEHREIAAAIDRLKEHADKLWAKALSGKASSEELTIESRNLQDEIYDRRRRSPLIFDWIYKRLRRSHEEQMNQSAELMIEDATKSLG